MATNFAYELGDYVQILDSREAGDIIARSDSIGSPNQYFVRYKAADGRMVKAWWEENELLFLDRPSATK